MVAYDFDAEIAKITEYQGRSQREERRGPTGQFEFQEQEGWSDAVKAHVKNIKRVPFGLSDEDVDRLVGVNMGQEQKRWHNDHDINVVEDEIAVNDAGGFEMIYMARAMTLVRGKEEAEKMLSKFDADTNIYLEHNPPGPPKHKDDKRFGEGYLEDKVKADAAGWKCGIKHIALRRENGNPQQIPGLTAETLGEPHKFAATDRYMRHITEIKQVIGMLYQVLLPTEYENSTEVVRYWVKNSAFEALVHTEREIATTTVMNINTIAKPHFDTGDDDDTMTVLHVWGDYDREKGGQFSIPILGKTYTMYPDSLLFLRSKKYLHSVRRPVVNGQRFSMVHTTQKNMADFDALQLPPTPAEKSASLKNPRQDEDAKCPYCKKEGRQSGGLQSVNKHLLSIIASGKGNELHDLEEIQACVERNSAAISRKRKERSAAKLAARMEEAKRRREDDEGFDSRSEAEDAPPSKRQKLAKIKASNKYERYGAALFAESAERGSGLGP
ncbi:hypothetical protein EG329_008156 [Mollisiaceae sp. DMI_Dod_QoI]|nr:hypothetical protein EG329_008156 [Helotiales sp. DMI_Dod_QoI]